MLFPIGLEDARVNRWPWVSAAIVILNVAAFLATWVIPGEDNERVEAAAQALWEHWSGHAELDPPAPCRRLLRPVADVLQRPGEAEPDPERSSPAASAAQTRFEQLCQEFIDAFEGVAWVRWSLVPSRGWGQAGWITHQFLHHGWLHLLGNLFLFFFLVGPFLEDVWGRPLFAGFYLAGGLAAGLGQALLDRSSSAPILGASGAIAACTGAFIWRFSRRRIRIAYWFFIFFRGTFLVPAWLWGLAWFASEVWSFRTAGPDAGVAFMAHIVGFISGLLVAAVLGGLRVEQELIAPRLAQGGWEIDPEALEAQEALDRGDRARARTLYRRLLTRSATNAEAVLGLARLELDLSGAEEGTRHAERVFHRALAAQGEKAVREALKAIGDRLDPGALSPAAAFRLAVLVADADGTLAERWFEAASRAEGDLRAKALIAHAQLIVRRGGDPERAAALVDRVAALSGIDPVARQRAAAFAETLRGLRGNSG